MALILNPICAIPSCYNRAVKKHRVSLGKLIVEVGICEGCEKKI